MNELLLKTAKALAPILVQVLKDYSKSTPSQIDDIAIDTIEFLLKRIGVMA